MTDYGPPPIEPNPAAPTPKHVPPTPGQRIIAGVVSLWNKYGPPAYPAEKPPQQIVRAATFVPGLWNSFGSPWHRVNIAEAGERPPKGLVVPCLCSNSAEVVGVHIRRLDLPLGPRESATVYIGQCPECERILWFE